MSLDPPKSGTSSPPPFSTELDVLPAGTRFGEFEVLRVLGIGGFGIVYLARDHSLERDVALKEYMPASLAARGSGPMITIRSSAYAETYAIGLRSFVNEARLLARFDHPSLVKVYRFWEDNATAYMVMPYMQGITLRDARRAMSNPPDEAWIRSVIDPILSGLELLHREGVYHRDIAPDNILLPPEGPPVLLDFGAARRVISDRTQSLTAILKPSYAPIEQYAEMTQLRQGPWTDLYALGAVVYYLLFGVPPSPATARAVQEDPVSIADMNVPGISPRMLEAVAWALALRPAQRPQSAAELRGAFDGSVAIPVLGRQSITLPGNLIGQAAAVPSPGASHHTMPTTFNAVDDDSTVVLDRATGGAQRDPRPATQGPAPTVTVPLWDDDPPGPVVPLPTALPSTSAHAAPAMAPMLPVTAVTPSTSSSPSPPMSAAQDASRGFGADPMPPIARGAPPADAGGGSTSTARSRGPLLIGAGAVVLVLVVAAIVFFTRSDRSVDAVASSAPASAALSSVDAASAAAAAAPSVVAVPAAEVTAAAPAPAIATAAPPVTADASGSAAKVALAASAASAAANAASRPKAGARGRGADGAASGVAAVERPPEPGSTNPSDPRNRTAREAVAPRPVPVSEPADAATAREACGDRGFVALALCMDRECEKPQYRAQGECVRVLEIKARRSNP